MKYRLIHVSAPHRPVDLFGQPLVARHRRVLMRRFQQLTGYSYDEGYTGGFRILGPGQTPEQVVAQDSAQLTLRREREKAQTALRRRRAQS